MGRVLVTGMSGTGKSTAPAEVGRRGFRVVDTDSPGLSDGKAPGERDLILLHLASVEPLLRATCTHEIDASRPLADVVDALIAIGQDTRR
ncbi:MAG: hypothetical protein M3546_07570 [Actinomycetota bacterium]|nr:hypothetical protein [Actinomycetota bacterium]